jgi:hypothetical protein
VLGDIVEFIIFREEFDDIKGIGVHILIHSCVQMRGIIAVKFVSVNLISEQMLVENIE